MSETTNPTEEVALPEITLIDLRNTIQIIDAAVERGAFKGNEITSIGTVRDKIAAFVVAATPIEEAAAEIAKTMEPGSEISVSEHKEVSKAPEKNKKKK